MASLRMQLARIVPLALALALDACSAGGPAPAPSPTVPTNLPTSTSKLDPNDLSVLVPLPKTEPEIGELLAATSVGLRGELLPADAFTKEMNELTLYPEYNGRDKLRVVAVRFDPCFPRPVADPCAAQLRLVMQPVALDPYTKEVRALDAAVHVFYTFDRAELVKMLNEMAAVKDGSPTSTAGALAPNPAIVAEGRKGSYMTGLSKLILAHAGAGAITRVTFTQVTASMNVWVWGGFDRKNGTMVPIGIAGTKTTSQRLDNNYLGTEPDDHFGVEVKPALDAHDATLTTFADDGTARSAPIGDVQKLVDSMVLMENPEKITPDEGTCTSCHVATPFRLWAERNRGVKTDTNPNRFPGVADVTSPAVLRLDSVRAFGWRERDWAISQRVANETAAIAAYVATIR